MATKREEYIAKLKTQLDQWNAEIGEVGSQAAQAQANMRAGVREAARRRSVSVRTRPRNTCARSGGLGRRLDGALLAARTRRPGRRCAKPSRRPARNQKYVRVRETPLRRPASPSRPASRRSMSLTMRHSDAQPPRPALPGLEPPSSARVDIVGLQLDDVERHHRMS